MGGFALRTTRALSAASSSPHPSLLQQRLIRCAAAREESPLLLPKTTILPRRQQHQLSCHFWASCDPPSPARSHPLPLFLGTPNRPHVYGLCAYTDQQQFSVAYWQIQIRQLDYDIRVESIVHRRARSDVHHCTAISQPSATNHLFDEYTCTNIVRIPVFGLHFRDSGAFGFDGGTWRALLGGGADVEAAGWKGGARSGGKCARGERDLSGVHDLVNADCYTIVVPANVRFRGVDMQLDVKIDQKTLAAASDISKVVEEAVVQSRTRRSTMAVATAEPLCATTSSAYVEANGIPTTPAAQTPSSSLFGASEAPSQSSDAIAQPCTSTTMSSPSGSNGSHDNIVPCSSSSSSSQNLSQTPQQNNCNNNSSQNDLLSSPSKPSQDPPPPPSEDGAPAAPAKPPAKKRRQKDQAQSVFCCFVDDNKECKQRAILKYQYCIRHILLDVTAPYKRCQHERKPKSKKDVPVKCTNAIHVSKNEDFCSTHLIMLGRREPKKKSGHKEENGAPASAAATETTIESVDSPACATPSTGEIYSQTHDPYSEHMFEEGNSCSSTTNSMQWQPSSVPPTSVPPPPHQQPVVMQQQPPQRYDMQPMSVENNGYLQQSPYDGVTVGEFVSSQMAQAQMQQPPVHPTSQPQQVPPQQVHHQQHHPRPAQIQSQPHQVPYDQHAHQQQMQPPHTPHTPHTPLTPNKMASPLQVGTMSNGNSATQSPFHSPYPYSSQETVGHYVQRQLPHLQQQMQQQQQPQIQPQAPQQMPAMQRHPQHLQHSQQQPQQYQPPPLSQNLSQNPSQQQIQVQQQPQPVQQHQFVQPAPPPLSRRQSVQQSVAVQQQKATMVSRTPTVSSLLSRPQNSHPHQQPAMTRQFQRVVVQQQGLPPSGAPKMVVTAVPQINNVLPWNAPVQVVLEKPQQLDPKLKVPHYTCEEAEAKIKPEEDDDSFLDAYLQSDEKRPPKKKMILKPKRYRMKMIGSYRNVPSVDHMCKMFEDSDFDKTDLFPLGLEPSDDEDSYSDDDFFNISGDWCRRMAHDGIANPSTSSSLTPATELYMLKKQLRLERHRLLRLARINAPILVASKTHANSAGAALRHRSMRIRDTPYNLTKTTGSTCVHMVPNANPDGSSKRCSEPAVPRSFHCRDHICDTKDQHVFQFCENKCGKTLSMVEAHAFEMICAACHRAKESKEKAEVAAAEAAAASAAADSIHSNPNSGMMIIDGGMPNPSEAVYSDPFLGIHDSDANEEGVLDVVRNLGFDDSDITEMMAELPVDDDLGMDPYMSMSTMQPGGQDGMNHDWCDVEDFLAAEGWGTSDLSSL
ncbi:hypothetical protein L596_024953 [Steinernema carpocapsae]|uniref:KANL2-like probable zinc-finger domain-containing protein n=1 Tax=Steinernema carpocapsae TaxID=34508 RepID=A0A4U5M6C7_STECR|nr:hypothetical protein L596_024953 [Steinernema carpocapsae]